MQKIKILYEDSNILAIDKPAGISVHGGGRTIVDFIRKKIEDDDSVRPGMIHRLDRESSGVLIIARTSLAKTLVQQQSKERKVRKA